MLLAHISHMSLSTYTAHVCVHMDNVHSQWMANVHKSTVLIVLHIRETI